MEGDDEVIVAVKRTWDSLFNPAGCDLSYGD
jgi:hypothetical protein